MINSASVDFLEQTCDQCLKTVSIKKSSKTNMIEYTTLKRLYITTKDTFAVMFTEIID